MRLRVERNERSRGEAFALSLLVAAPVGRNGSSVVDASHFATRELRIGLHETMRMESVR